MFMNFVVLWLFAKVFSAKFGGMAFFGAGQASNLRKFSLGKTYFSPIRESFLPRKFPTIRYLGPITLSVSAVWQSGRGPG